MSKKFLSVAVLITLALFLDNITRAEEESIFPPCSGAILKYFPKGRIEIVIGEPVRTENILFTSCVFIPKSSSYSENSLGTSFNQAPSSDVAVKFMESHILSPKQPGIINLVKGKDICDQYVLGKNIGEDQDENDYFGVGQKNNFVFIVSSENLPQVGLNQIKDILRYACSQVPKTSPSKSPSITPTPPEPTKTPSQKITETPTAKKPTESPKKEEEKNKDPRIKSRTPGGIISAGVKTGFLEEVGVVLYGNNSVLLEILGENLDGAQLKANNQGIDGEPGIEFHQVKVRDKGRQVLAQMNVKPTAKEGFTRITLTNSYGRSTYFDIYIRITGTQYLKRKFAGEKVHFLGDWPTVDQRVLQLEKEVRKGLGHINTASYNKLNIITQVYEVQYWQDYAVNKYCGGGTKGIVVNGCALFEDNIIHILESGGDSVIVHESAHKLHLYYLGLYGAGPKALPNNFALDWKNAVGIVDPQSCPHLPLKDPITWKNGEKVVPRCGFARAYGASDLKDFFEDIATMTEFKKIGSPELFQLGDGPTDKRYQLKENVLKKYGFL